MLLVLFVSHYFTNLKSARLHTTSLLLASLET